MPLLPGRVSLGQNRPWLAQTKVHAPEQTLALTDAQLNSVFLSDPRRQGFAIPKIYAHANVAWLSAQCPIDRCHLLLIQAARSPSVLSFL
jgi:hypothetical protein